MVLSDHAEAVLRAYSSIDLQVVLPSRHLAEFAWNTCVSFTSKELVQFSLFVGLEWSVLDMLYKMHVCIEYCA